MTWLDKATEFKDGPERLDEILPAMAEWLKTHQWNDETQEWEGK